VRFKIALAVSLVFLIVGLLVSTTVTTAPEERIYKQAMHDDITTTNYINYLGPGATVWTAYVLGNMHRSLYTLADVTWMPILGLAEDYATPVVKEGDFWTSEVCITPGELWSDGTEITAEDVAFSFNGILEMDPIALGGNWPSIVDPDYVDHVDVIDKYCVKFYLLQKPGLARWEYGLLQAPILQKAYWGPKFEHALATADPVATLLAEPATDEPSAGSFVFKHWEPGAYAEIERNWAVAPEETEGKSRLFECATGFYAEGSVDPVYGGGYRGELYFVAATAEEFDALKGIEGDIKGLAGELELVSYTYNDANKAVKIRTEAYDKGKIEALWSFVNGAMDKVKEAVACEVAYAGDFNPGPYVDAVVYPLYGTMAAAALAVIAGDVHYHLNPLGYEKGLADQLREAPNVEVIENAANGFFYLSFNLRKSPFNNIWFRKAVDCLIDREYVTEELLAGVAIPGYHPVPPGNAYWYKELTPEQKDARCVGFTRAEKVKRAVEYLKQGGFSWEVEPEVLPDGTIKPGKGLMLNGVKVPEIELIHPNPAYDNKRNIFGLHVAKVLNEVGIPLRNVPTGFRVIVSRVFVEQDFDMWELGWGLGIYPDHLEAFFHSRNTEPGGFNPEGYSNPEFDALADALLAEQDLAKAREIVFQMLDMLSEELPYAVLFYAPVVEGYRKDMVEYPFTTVLDGLQMLNGMPSYVKLIE